MSSTPLSLRGLRSVSTVNIRALPHLRSWPGPRTCEDSKMTESVELRRGSAADLPLLEPLWVSVYLSRFSGR
jgi:hypothetical protein